MTAASTFRAIGDATRRDILDLLLLEGPLQAGDLAGRFPHISRPAVSKHVRVLRRAGMVAVSRKGRERWYALDAAPLRQVQAWVEGYEAYWQDKLGELKDMVEGED
jgi:DNA-binding transcriptional ArsR family regulator